MLTASLAGPSRAELLPRAGAIALAWSSVMTTALVARQYLEPLDASLIVETEDEMN